MHPRITMITLGVTDLDRSVAFFDLRPRPGAFKATGAAAERFDARIGMLPCHALA